MVRFVEKNKNIFLESITTIKYNAIYVAGIIIYICWNMKSRICKLYILKYKKK